LYREWKKVEFSKEYIYIYIFVCVCVNLGTTILGGRPRNRWQDEVREDGRIVGREGWPKKIHDREEWKKLPRTARNRRILHMSME